MSTGAFRQLALALLLGLAALMATAQQDPASAGVADGSAPGIFIGEATHMVPGLTRQGIVFVMTIGIRRTEGGVLVRLIEAEASYNSDAIFNAIDPDDVYNMGLRVVAGRDCEGCSPGFVEDGPQQWRFAEGVLSHLADPQDVFVPDSVLA